MTTTTQVTIDEVLDFWFGELDGDGMMRPGESAKWWKKDAAFDEVIRSRFGEAVEAASRGELDGWAETPRGAVALIVLLDQFSRNIFRDSPRAFAQDARALAVARDLADGGQLGELPDAWHYIALMPWMHSESREDHARAARLWQAGADAADSEGARKMFLDGLDFEQRHARIVERFGRYPHRNAVLGRESTAEELEFLKEPGSSF